MNDTASAAPVRDYPQLPDFETVEQHIYGACRRYITQDMLEPIHNLIRDAIDADRAMRAQAAPAAVASPLTKLQRKAIAVCFTSDKVSVSELQRKLSISYADAQTLCQSIVDLGLTDELELAPSLKQRGAPAPHPAPVAQGEPLAWMDDGTLRVGSEATAYRVVTDATKRGMTASLAASFIKPEAPPRPPDGNGLPRYGLRWNGPGEPVSVPMDDGYWTPWHLTEMLRAQLAEAQRDSERLDWMIEQCAYVVSDPDCCDGYWLNYPRKDGTVWTQATEHETPRAAIDAAKGESNGTVRAERSGFDTLPDDYKTGDY